MIAPESLEGIVFIFYIYLFLLLSIIAYPILIVHHTISLIPPSVGEISTSENPCLALFHCPLHVFDSKITLKLPNYT